MPGIWGFLFLILFYFMTLGHWQHQFDLSTDFYVRAETPNFFFFFNFFPFCCLLAGVNPSVEKKKKQ